MSNLRITFSDWTTTLLATTEDDNAIDAVVDLCEHEGWDTKDVLLIEEFDETDEVTDWVKGQEGYRNHE